MGLARSSQIGSLTFEGHPLVVECQWPAPEHERVVALANHDLEIGGADSGLVSGENQDVGRGDQDLCIQYRSVERRQAMQIELQHVRIGVAIDQAVHRGLPRALRQLETGIRVAQGRRQPQERHRPIRCLARQQLDTPSTKSPLPGAGVGGEQIESGSELIPQRGQRQWPEWQRTDAPDTLFVDQRTGRRTSPPLRRGSTPVSRSISRSMVPSSTLRSARLAVANCARSVSSSCSTSEQRGSRVTLRWQVAHPVQQPRQWAHRGHGRPEPELHHPRARQALQLRNELGHV